MRKPAIIIDANVPCQAGKSPSGLSPEEAVCTSICSRFIGEFIKDKSSRLALDDAYRILNEYGRVCVVNSRHEPNMTSIFRRWAHEYYAKNYCKGDVVTLNELGENHYLEYPDDPALIAFDLHDKKYIAVAYAHPEHPHIYNAMDTDWWPVRKILAALGITVNFICEEYIRNHAREE